MKIWLDGKLVEQEEAKTSVFDHGTLYGDGIFEGIRFYNKRVFRLEDHMDRLYNCAHYLLLDIPYTREELSNAVCETAAASGLSDGWNWNRVPWLPSCCSRMRNAPDGIPLPARENGGKA